MAGGQVERRRDLRGAPDLKAQKATHFLWGMEKSFEGVTRRAKYLSSYGTAFELFEKHYIALQNCYAEFFPSLQAMVLQTLKVEGFILP